MNLDTPIREIKGIGEKTEKLMNKIGVYTAGDILLHFPRQYQQFDAPIHIDELKNGEKAAIYAVVRNTPLVRRIPGRNMSVISAKVQDDTGKIDLVWFNADFVKHTLVPGNAYVFLGKVENKGNRLQISTPEIFSVEEYKVKMQSLQPVYSKTQGLTNKTIQKSVRCCLENIDLETEFMPKDIRINQGLAEYNFAMEQIHFPENSDKLIWARKRLVFDEFFFFILRMQFEKEKKSKEANLFPLSNPDFIFNLIDKLPYSLTGAQMRCIKEVFADMSSDFTMQRLIQGDVGSGKTVIAFLCMAWMSYNGYQSALMAPTEVLARQHKESFEAMQKMLGLKYPVILLTGSLTAKEKREAYKQMVDHPNSMIIGTQALIQEKAVFDNLGLVITDEQHRFGVKQRETLAGKGKTPHIIVMSATPIPRTLAIILYGDMDISVIDEVPAKRLPIKNCVVGENFRQKANEFIVKEVNLGHQIYVICPLVEESEGMEGKDVKNHARALSEQLPSNIKVGVLHGKMKPKEKNEIMESFAKNETNVLVSTTVVEVGVNVPNATVMVIENADRFGLAQLHQLRGRVGRGDAQSYCIMMNSSKSKTAEKRLDILNKSNDGFFISSEDLKLRGPGDFFGIRQSGDMVFDIADIYQDADVLKAASEEVKNLLEKDPSLSDESHRRLKYYLLNTYEKKFNSINL